MPIPKNAADAAKKHFEQHFGTGKIVVAEMGTDRHPHDGRAIHCFVAARAGVANDKHAELIVDDEGQSVHLPNERRRLFLSRVEPVPPHLVAAAKVKISPAVNNLRLGECDVVKETITVEIPASAAVAPADIYFLADNTKSMGSVISNVISGVSAPGGILPSLSAYPGLQFGVGEYRDFDAVGDQSLAFQNLQAITANPAAVAAAIGTWSASGGLDLPEAQLFALDQVAASPAIGWRPGVNPARQTGSLPQRVESWLTA